VHAGCVRVRRSGWPSMCACVYVCACVFMFVMTC